MVLDTKGCGCCDGLTARAPVLPENPPMLAEFAYRSGDWQTFRDTMLARLGSAEAGALAELATRDARDPTIALIDAWAVLGDILTFYNERLLSESLLRSAGELDSLHAMARLLGYQPNPGVAAEADIAFTMDTAEGAPLRLSLGPGIKVQSTPGPGEMAVTYETTAPVVLRPAWNTLRPQLFADHSLGGTTHQLWLAGTDLLASPGDGVSFAGPGGAEFATIHRVERRPANRAEDPDARDFTVLHIRTLDTGAAHNSGPLTASVAFIPPEPAASYTGRTIDADDLAAELTAASHDEDQVFEIFASQSAPQPKVTLYRARAAMFGHNALDYDALPLALRGEVPIFTIDEGEVVADGTETGPYINDENAWADGNLDVLDEDGDGTLHLEGAQPQLAESTAVVLRDGNTWAIYTASSVAETSYARFAQSGKATRVQLNDTTAFDSLSIRGTVAYIAAETVSLAQPPVTGSISDASTEPLRLQGYAPGLTAGTRVAITGRRLGDGEAETRLIATLTEVTHDFNAGGGSLIRIDPDLPGVFLRTSLRFNANVAPATHGESVAEILGDGDAAKPFLKATLKQAPQTHVSDDSPSGAGPTLEVRINDILWEQVPDFLDQPADARVYTSRIGPDGATALCFGDGFAGARPPTGSQNMRATYRKELGLAGRVGPDSLTMLLSRPLGLSGANNPLPSSGGADPEPVDAIRENAPLTVRTLDRAVSAIDYEDFARGYAGIAKASAQLVVQGVVQKVHITVAGEAGETVSPGTALHDNLAGALMAASDPYRQFFLSSFRPATFRFGARIQVDPAYLSDKVLAEVETALRARFGFDAGRLAGSVWRSAAIAEIHRVPGVVAVDMTAFHRDFTPLGAPAPVGDFPGLGVEDARVLSDGTTLGAELLTLHPGPLDQLVVMP